MPDLNTQSHQFLHSYCIRPDIRFDTQADNESIILVLRAHPITQIPWIFNSIVFFMVLVILNFIFPTFFDASQIIFINIFVSFLILTYVWFSFINWFFNVGIISSQRVVDIDFANIIYKEVTEARLDKIEDITSKTGGFIQSFFNFGNLFIQTAGTESNVEFLNIPNPSDVVRIIDDLTGK